MRVVQRLGVVCATGRVYGPGLFGGGFFRHGGIDLDGLQEVLRSKERILQDIRRVELERHGVLENLARILEMDWETLTLSRLAEVSSEPF